LIEGINSFGSECGHVIVDSREDARLCVWGGGRGELEAYASASAVIERTQECLDQGRPSELRKKLETEELTPLLVGEVANTGDQLALDILAETGRYLGIGIVSMVHMIDPGMVVLGGAMNFGGHESRAGRHFLESVRSEFRKRAFDVVCGTTIDFARLGGDAGYIGCAGIARQAWHKSHGRIV